MINLKQGDCLELMKELKDKSVDLILCDLPYQKLKAKWDVALDTELLWRQYNRIIKDNGAILLFGAEPFASKLRLSNEKYYRYDWIWQKAPRLPFMAKKRPMSAVEYILVFYKHLPTYNPQMVQGKPWTHGAGHKVGQTRSKDNAKEIYGISEHDKLVTNSGLRYPINIIKFSGATNQYNKSYHPTQKPVDLLEYLIKTYTNENDLVLDNTMGSGSTGVACIKTNRNFVGMEFDKNYFQVAVNRIKEARTEQNKRN